MKRMMWIVGGGVAVLGLLVAGLFLLVQEPVVAQDQQQAQPAAGASPEDPRAQSVRTHFGRTHFARGSVVEVEGDVFQVEADHGEVVAVQLSEQTPIWIPGQPPTTTVELGVGDPVLVIGAPASGDQEPDAEEAGRTGGRTLAAHLVVVVDDEDLPKYLIRGQAVTVTRQTIVAQAGRGERAMTVLPRTRFWSLQGRLEGLRDVRAGDRVLALGQPTEMGQWLAGAVLVLPPEGQARGGLRGKVTGVYVETMTLTVETARQDEVSVVADKETGYRIPGVEQPNFDDIQVGDEIVAAGRFEEESRDTYLARGIGVVPPAGENGP